MAEILKERGDRLSDAVKLKDPRVSVIIPTYNHAHYLGEAIQSALAQTYRDVEIIVVDDGSTDDTRAVVEQFGERVRYLWQENRGLSGARNRGIQAAQGELIGLLDADDLYEPEFLSTLVSLLDANPDMGAVYCGYRFVDIANNPLPQVEARTVPPRQFYDKLVDGNFLAPLCVLARRSCYDEVGLFDESLGACEDWDMWLRIARRYAVLGVDQVLTRVRIRPGSMSSDPARMLRNRLAVLKKQFGTASATESVARRRAYGMAHLRTAIEYLEHDNLDRACRYVREMLTICPELVAELPVFYELGFGGQPKGRRGDFATLDLERNGDMMFRLLGQVFDDAQRPAALDGYECLAYGNAYLALGLLCYGARQMREARSYLLRSAVTRPQNLLDRRLIVPFVKSFAYGVFQRVSHWGGPGRAAGCE